MKQPSLALLLLLLLAAAAAASKQASKRDWLADLRTEEAAATAWHKRSDEQQQADHLIASLGNGNSQFLLRSPRNSRQYDVPQIGERPEQQLAASESTRTLFKLKFWMQILGVVKEKLLHCSNGVI